MEMLACIDAHSKMVITKMLIIAYISLEYKGWSLHNNNVACPFFLIGHYYTLNMQSYYVT